MATGYGAELHYLILNLSHCKSPSNLVKLHKQKE